MCAARHHAKASGQGCLLPLAWVSRNQVRARKALGQHFHFHVLHMNIRSDTSRRFTTNMLDSATASYHSEAKYRRIPTPCDVSRVLTPYGILLRELGLKLAAFAAKMGRRLQRLNQLSIKFAVSEAPGFQQSRPHYVLTAALPAGPVGLRTARKVAIATKGINLFNIRSTDSKGLLACLVHFETCNKPLIARDYFSILQHGALWL